LHPNTLNPFLHQTSSFSRGSPKRELPVRCCLVSKKAGGVPRSSLP
jgi:hypothetical protein